MAPECMSASGARKTAEFQPFLELPRGLVASGHLPAQHLARPRQRLVRRRPELLPIARRQSPLRRAARRVVAVLLEPPAVDQPEEVPLQGALARLGKDEREDLDRRSVAAP